MLVVNAGSSSLKAALFDPDLRRTLSAAVSGIGGAARARIDAAEVDAAIPDHAAAIAWLLDALAARGHAPATLSAAAHRVVHGGAGFGGPARLTPAVVAAIERLVPLAPLHNPPALAAIRALAEQAPGLTQVAGFDTAFHATMPDVEATYALPEDDRAAGLRRYGFHGISYAGLAEALRARGALPRRLLAFHLGGGASLCAIVDGRSVATSMGFSPVSGLTMGTRSGDLDPMAVLDMARRHGIDGAADRLNRRAGLLALGGTPDMRALAGAGTGAARAARAHFVHWAVRHAGGAIAAMRGIDAMAFTGGIGENDSGIRGEIAAGLAWAGPVPVHVVPADEERTLARDAARLLEDG